MYWILYGTFNVCNKPPNGLFKESLESIRDIPFRSLSWCFWDASYSKNGVIGMGENDESSILDCVISSRCFCVLLEYSIHKISLRNHSCKGCRTGIDPCDICRILPRKMGVIFDHIVSSTWSLLETLVRYRRINLNWNIFTLSFDDLDRLPDDVSLRSF